MNIGEVEKSLCGGFGGSNLYQGIFVCANIGGVEKSISGD